MSHTNFKVNSDSILHLYHSESSTDIEISEQTTLHLRLKSQHRSIFTSNCYGLGDIKSLAVRNIFTGPLATNPIYIED